MNKIAMGWNNSYLHGAVERLCSLIGAGAADFSEYLILVPTAEAGRLLREEIAAWFYRRETGVVGLMVVQPEFILQTKRECASDALVIANWVSTLKTCLRSDFEILFKRADFPETPQFFSGVAEKLQECRLTLASSGLSVTQVAEKLVECEGEVWYNQCDRFRAFAGIELDFLKRFGLTVEPVAGALSSIAAPNIPDGVTKIILIGCMEVGNGVISAIQRSGIQAEAWIPAPEEELMSFDEYGRPIPEIWEKREIDFNLENSVRRYAKPADQAEKLIEALRVNPSASVVGILDAEVAGFFIDKCKRDINLPEFYKPENRTLSELPFTQFFIQLLSLADPEIRFEDIALLARCSFVQNYFSALNPSVLLCSLDEAQKIHLFSTFGELCAANVPGAEVFVNEVKNLRNEILLAENLPLGVWSVFRKIVNASCGDGRLNEILFEIEPLKSVVAEVAELRCERELSRVLLLSVLGKRRVAGKGNFSGKPEISGFMELVWRRERNIVIAGFNEESFNYSDGTDQFLPDMLREYLGMSTSANSYAADVVKFYSLLQSRSELKILFGGSSTGGEILKPSRMLLQRDVSRLPDAVRLLFSGTLNESVPICGKAEEGVYPPYFPPRKMPLDSMSITGFKNYLECPFKFYRENVLKTREVNDRNVELDALSWGTLVHKVVEQFGNSRRHGGVKEIEEFCLHALNAEIGVMFGRGSLGIIELQRELIELNLREFAKIQADLFKDGWEIFKTEHKVSCCWNELYSKVFPLAPHEPWRAKITLKGKIDRIDRKDKMWRIFDYKTSAKAKTPMETHIGTALSVLYRNPLFWPNERCARSVPEMSMKKNYYWCDLQLPIYVLMTAFGFGDELIELPSVEMIGAAYFNFPLNYPETGISEFSELNSNILTSAAACGDEVLRRIYVDHAFWPPKNPGLNGDRFAKLAGSAEISDFIGGFDKWRMEE